MDNKPIFVAHVIHRLNIGGLENGMVNLINRLPGERYRHAVICLTDYDTEFRSRIAREDVDVYSLHRREGRDWRVFVNVFRLLRRIRPDIVHTRNLATIECQIPAFLAGVKARIHGEHGWDIYDPNGSNVKYQWLRRFVKPFIQCFIPLSRELENYLLEKVHVPPEKITRICNGVDTERFCGQPGGFDEIPECPFSPADHTLIGTVGRMNEIKDPLNLVHAFISLMARDCEWKKPPRLVMVGGGPLYEQAIAALEEANLAGLAWLPGPRDDIPEILRGLDIFVLPSRGEGISNTILEAMASGLPVIATDVGGNADLVEQGLTGYIVPAQNPAALVDAIVLYAEDGDHRLVHAKNGLKRTHRHFSLDGMVSNYDSVYQRMSG